jgi:hypothetical protein
VTVTVTVVVTGSVTVTVVVTGVVTVTVAVAVDVVAGDVVLAVVNVLVVDPVLVVAEPEVVALVRVVVVVGGGQACVESTLKSPCFACAFQALEATVILTHRLVALPVRWQMEILPADVVAEAEVVAVPEVAAVLDVAICGFPLPWLPGSDGLPASAVAGAMTKATTRNAPAIRKNALFAMLILLWCEFGRWERHEHWSSRGVVATAKTKGQLPPCTVERWRWKRASLRGRGASVWTSDHRLCRVGVTIARSVLQS